MEGLFFVTTSHRLHSWPVGWVMVSGGDGFDMIGFEAGGVEEVVEQGAMGSDEAC